MRKVEIIIIMIQLFIVSFIFIGHSLELKQSHGSKYSAAAMGVRG